MDTLYNGLPLSQLMYVEQSLEQSKEQVNALATYNQEDFNRFKYNWRKYYKQQPESYFLAVETQSKYAKAIHQNYLTRLTSHLNYIRYHNFWNDGYGEQGYDIIYGEYTKHVYYNVNPDYGYIYSKYMETYWNSSNPVQSNMSDLSKLEEYLRQTNQEIPSVLQEMIDEKQASMESSNQHINTLISSKDKAAYSEIVAREKLTAQATPGYGDYSKEYTIPYEGNGGIHVNFGDGYGGYIANYQAWTRHGNWGNYTRMNQFSYYANNHTPYSKYSDYRDYYNNHHTDYYHINLTSNSYVSYRKTVIFQPVMKNFIPTGIQVFAPEQLQNIENDITLGYFSYDKDSEKSDLYKTDVARVYYKIEIRKLTGANQRGWTVVLNNWGLETFVLKSKDPFNLGWTSPSQYAGDYQIRITPYNKPSNHALTGVVHEYNYEWPQLEGPSAVLNFKLGKNSEPSICVDANSQSLGDELFMDGAIAKGTNIASAGKWDYPTFYGSGVPAQRQRGLHMYIYVKDADVGQYLKAKANLKNKANGALVISKEIRWSDNSTVIRANGNWQLGYIYISSDELYNKKFNGLLELEVQDYYDAACTQLASTSSIKQTVAGNGSNRVLLVDFDMQKTLHFDYITNSATTDITVKPKVVAAANQEGHLKNSLAGVDYYWSNSATTPASNTYTVTPYNKIEVSPPSEGVWYLHLRARDKYGKTLTERVGPIYYSTTQLTLASPLVEHFDDSDRLRVTAKMATKPNIGVTYQYRYAYKKKGTPDSNYVYSAWSTSPTFITPNVKLYEGVDIITEVKIVETGYTVKSGVLTTDLNDKLYWCIHNQGLSNYNLESSSLPYYDIHNSTGILPNGFKVMTPLPEYLSKLLRNNEYFYYKLNSDNTYDFRKIIYFNDPIG